ncbi:DNA-3-methyladenine glycosylase [Candidatus Pacearchaeota archaeon]|nr:DNA-3-methyladenine glycosylase [Candidatus Pacearchaeota archaeon]
MKALPQSFFALDSRQVGYDLVGKLLVRNYKGKKISGIISQVDAYSMRNAVPNNRNRGAFYTPGAIHMYPSQGNYMLAISTFREDIYNEVLIRQVIPLEGIEIMMKHKGSSDEKNLTNGPGKLVKAFGLDKELDGTFITDNSTGLWITMHLTKPSVRKEKETENGDESNDFVGRYTLVDWKQ